MNGFQMLFWAVVYEAYNLVFHPRRRWEMDCAFCDETTRARSNNMALTKNSLHVHFADDHPDGPEDTDLDWGNPAGHNPRRVDGDESNA
jgi:hypothetical protein